MQDHSLRRTLNDELHARPFLPLRAPERATHIAMLSGEGGFGADRAHLARLCSDQGAPAPVDANHFVHDFGAFRLKWERHTEFCTYTFFARAEGGAPFENPALSEVPEDWLNELPGKRLTATHLHLMPTDSMPPSVPDLAQIFGGEIVAASVIFGRAAAVCTDFRIREDGYGRILLMQSPEVSRRAAGRLVQRLFEIETYRMMALLAFPVALDVGPKVSAIERALADIASSLPTIEGMADERRFLDRLSGLSAELEGIIGATSYRFSAARAYNTLIERHIAELREHHIARLQTIGEVMDRRLAPAMRTCESVVGRQETVSGRLARASDLLRTRVDIALEQQNRDLLKSMNRRAQQQVRLQQTVEGLSVAAISYYLVSLVGYILKAVEEAGLDIPVYLFQGLAIPAVVLLVWAGLRRVRKHLLARGRTGEPGAR